MANDKTFMEDQESLQALVDLLPDRLRLEYEGYKALNLEAGFPGRKLVVYQVANARPQNVQILSLGDMHMSPRGGPMVEVTGTGGEPLLVGMVPQKLPGREIFLHLPQRFEFKWKGKRSTRSAGGVNFAPHYAILVKSRSKAHMAIEGHTYCVRLNQFREMFPEVQVAY